jgi:hypothetical protein
MKLFSHKSLLVPLLFFGVSFLARAQDTAAVVGPSVSPQTAMSAVRAARLVWFHGDFEIQRTDNTAAAATPEHPEPDSAAINMPIPEGSRLLTGEGAEAELEFEDGSVVRMTPNTVLLVESLTVGGLNESSDSGSAAGQVARTQLSLLNGLAFFELRHAPAVSYVVAAGKIVVSPADNVVFRIELDQPPALVAVLSGSLNVSADLAPEAAASGGFNASVKAGESLHADPDDPSRYFLNDQLAENSWDAWNQTRDAEASAEASTRTSARDAYAGSQGYGWSDLDANGTWYTVTNADGTTSELWQPAIAADPDPVSEDSGATDADGFDPYGDGAFVDSGGAYLWASSYTWGWLPYRCGQWNYYPLFGWAWTPNHLCGIYGYGGGIGINIGRHPHHYHPLRLPPVSPVHPILRVHNLNPRPPVPRKWNPAPVKLATLTAMPMQPVLTPVLPTSGWMGGSLYRDYPVQGETHKPVLGTIAAPVAERTPVTGWIAPPVNAEAPRVVRTPSPNVLVRPVVSNRVPASERSPQPRPASPAPAPRPSAPAAAPRPAPAPSAPAPSAPSKPK